MDLLLDETIQFLLICYVERVRTDFVLPMLADKIIKAILSAADSDDFASFLHEPIRKGSSYTGCSTNHENVFILERHSELYLIDLISAEAKNTMAGRLV